MNNKGSMLIGALFLVAFIALVSVPVMQVVANEHRSSINQQLSVSTQYLAEAGLLWGEETVMRGQALPFVLGPFSLDPGSPDQGTFTVLAELDPVAGEIVLTSTGTLGAAKTSLTLTLIPGAPGIKLDDLDMAAFGIDNLLLGGSADIQGQAGTNSATVDLNGQSFSVGSVWIGPDADPAAAVDPKKYPGLVVANLPEERTYEVPEFPEYPILPAATWDGSSAIAQSCSLGDIEVKNNQGPLVIDTTGGDVLLRVDDLSFKNSGLVITGDNDVFIYVDGTFSADNSSINASGTRIDQLVILTKQTSDVTLLGQGNSSVSFVGSVFAEQAGFKLGGNATLTAAFVTGGTADCEIKGTSDTEMWSLLYAPNARVDVSGNARFHGSLIGKTLVSSGSGTIIYDDGAHNQIPIQFKAKDWSRGVWKYGR